jgi:UDP-N-acetylglucosamine diphosphorylase / glucose-1-phosphate thymidylyltransferase / UDP-N-acetylgalactosamine diphosphorylase / glucosamine-1-phosphate N-acetyltransferase / galactosamine-1-phosphate N-acetyltransferase
MKAVILAAGEGKRMQPLTFTTPKPMLPLRGKPLIEHIIDTLPSEVNELIIVIGYLGDQIKDYFGAEWKGRPITYVWQAEKKGTFHALKMCEAFLTTEERFFIIYADDMHGREGIEQAIGSGKQVVLTAEVEDPCKFGVLEIDTEGKIVNLEEKPEHPKSNLISNGAYVLSRDIFDYEPEMRNGEVYLADAILKMVQGGKEVYAMPGSFWLTIGNPEELDRAEVIYKAKEAAEMKTSERVLA